MNGLLFVVIGLANSLPSAAPVEKRSQAERIIAGYLAMPQPEDQFGEARQARWQVLGQLKALPDEAVSAVRRTLADVKNPRQREELAAAVADQIHTNEAAALLRDFLKDGDAQVRSKAIHGLRMMARQTDRIGGKRTQRGQDFAPKVKGLVPWLIEAADDKAEQNRISALYALADACDPAAVAELRRRLQDPSDRVRLYAACFLTEFQDASGLPEMRAALERMSKQKPQSDLDRYGSAEMLLASLERITGKSFGEIPMNPHLCSDTTKIAEYEQRYGELLRIWAQWWAWEPSGMDRTLPR